MDSILATSVFDRHLSEGKKTRDFNRDLIRASFYGTLGFYKPDLRIVGNTMMTLYNQRITLRGVSLGSVVWSAPLPLIRRLHESGLDVNCVRIPVHYMHFLGETSYTMADIERFLKERVDAAIQACQSYGYYVILDWHPIADWTNPQVMDDAVAFWTIAAERYKHLPHVVFEIFNEPKTVDITDRTGWLAFRDALQPVVDAVRAVSDKIVIVGSPHWTTSLQWAKPDDFATSNIAYAYHCYPNHGATHPQGFAHFLAQRIPEDLCVVFTEIGFDPITNEPVTRLYNNPAYPEEMIKHFNANPQHGFCLWSWDGLVQPAMLGQAGDMVAWAQELLGLPMVYEGVPPLPPPNPAFTLSDIEGQLAVAYDFTDKTTLSIDGIAVKGALDLSGNGGHAAETAAAPTNVPGGGVFFDGTSHILQIPALPPSCTVFARVKIPQSVPGNALSLLGGSNVYLPFAQKNAAATELYRGAGSGIKFFIDGARIDPGNRAAMYDALATGEALTLEMQNVSGALIRTIGTPTYGFHFCGEIEKIVVVRGIPGPQVRADLIDFLQKAGGA